MDKYINEQNLLALSGPDFFFITVVSFSILYFFFTLVAYFVFKSDYFIKYQNPVYRLNQNKIEIKRSLVSILMFGVLSIPIYYGLKFGFFKIKFEFSVTVLLLEVALLFLWNEVHFYTIHRLFHSKSLYRFHAAHHYSHVPSPFSAYSFHWSEGLLLGAVMPIIMCFHDFQVVSLMILPLLSIGLNVLGHSNIDFFPNRAINNLLSFSKRHSHHHKDPRSNFGFFLPYIDTFMQSNGQEIESK